MVDRAEILMHGQEFRVLLIETVGAEVILFEWPL